MNKSNRLYDKLLRYPLLFLIALIFLLLYLIYTSISLSLTANKEQLDLLSKQSLFNENKAMHNDLGIRQSKANNSIKTLTKDIESFRNTNSIESSSISSLQFINKEKSDMIQSSKDLLYNKESEIKGYDNQQLYLNDIYTTRNQIKDTIRLIDQYDINSNTSPNIDSNIITSLLQLNILKKWIIDNDPTIKEIKSFELLFRLSNQQRKIACEFHERCDAYPNTIVVIKLKDDSILGGYTTQTWQGDEYKSDPYSFIFNLTYKKKFPINNKKKNRVIYSNRFYLPAFGLDLNLYSTTVICDFPKMFGSPESYFDLNNGEQISWVADFEVFHVLF